jgi:hypothetical protein
VYVAGFADYGIGTFAWTIRKGVGGTGFTTVDSLGNVFVTGLSSPGSGAPYDYATVAYSSVGIPLWTNRYNGDANGYDWAKAIAVDSNGNVFVTGSSEGGSATIAYSNTGVPLWTNRSTGVALALDGSGNVFVTGSSQDSQFNNDYATIKYSGAGVPLWTKRYNGLGSLADTPAAIAVDSDGNVFVTGSSQSACAHSVRRVAGRHRRVACATRTNAGFTFQSAPSVTGPFTNLPGATSRYTNPLTAPQQFFRLISN